MNNAIICSRKDFGPTWFEKNLKQIMKNNSAAVLPAKKQTANKSVIFASQIGRK